MTAITVLFPCYKESVEDIKAAVKKIQAKKYLGFEIDFILSVNGEPITKYQQIKQVQLVHTNNKGIGHAITIGLKHARGTYTYIISPDLPFQLTDLDQMIHGLEYDLQIGSKLHAQSTYKAERLRVVTSHSMHLLTRLLFPSLAVRDPNGSYFGKTSILKKISEEVRARDYFFLTEMCILAQSSGCTLKEVPVNYIRQSPSSVRAQDGARYLTKLFTLRWQMVPTIQVVGFTVFVISVVYYLSPLFDYTHNLVGTGADIYSHTWYLDWFCRNYYRLNFITSELFTPYGVNFAKGYDMPAIATLTCPWTKLHPVAGMNALAIVQLSLVWISSWLVAQKYLKHKSIQVAFMFLYGFLPFVMLRMRSHYNLISTVWGASFILYAFHRLDLQDKKKVMWASSIAAFTLASSWQNWANLTPLIAIFTIQNIWNNRSKLRRVLSNLFLGGIVGTIIALPFVAPMIIASLGSTLSTQKASLVAFAGISTFIMPWKNSFWYPVVTTVISDTNLLEEQIVGMDPLIMLSGVCISLYTFIKYRRVSQKVIVLSFMLYAIAPFGQMLNIGTKKYLIGYMSWLYSLPPLMLTRVPSRVVIVWALLFLIYTLREIDTIAYKLSKTKQLIILGGLATYAVIATTIGSNNIQIRYTAYNQIFPISELDQMSSDSETSVALNLPLKNDPSQNFMQLFHKKKLVTGYISYAMQETETNTYINSSPLIRLLNCDLGSQLTNTLPWNSNNSFEPVFNQFIRNSSVDYIIVNRNLYRNDASCQMFYKWIQNELPNYLHVKTIASDNSYSILKITQPLDIHTEPTLYVGIDSKEVRMTDSSIITQQEVTSFNIVSSTVIPLTYKIGITVPENTTVQLTDPDHEITLTSGENSHVSTFNTRVGSNIINIITDCSQSGCTNVAIDTVDILSSPDYGKQI